MAKKALKGEKESADMKAMREKMMKKMSLGMIVFGILWLLVAFEILPEWVLGTLVILLGLKMLIWRADW